MIPLYNLSTNSKCLVCWKFHSTFVHIIWFQCYWLIGFHHLLSLWVCVLFSWDPRASAVFHTCVIDRLCYGSWGSVNLLTSCRRINVTELDRRGLGWMKRSAAWAHSKALALDLLSEFHNVTFYSLPALNSMLYSVDLSSLFTNVTNVLVSAVLWDVIRTQHWNAQTGKNHQHYLIFSSAWRCFSGSASVHYNCVCSCVCATSANCKSISRCLITRAKPMRDVCVFCPQAEIVKRLNGICAQVLPYLSQEVSLCELFMIHTL